MEDEEIDNREENKKRALLALALLLGLSAGNQKIGSYEDLESSSDAMRIVKSKYDNASDELKQAVESKERISEQKLQTEMAKSAVDDGVKLMRIVTAKDGKVCSKCREWHGKVVSVDGRDSKHPSVIDFINSGGLHYNCRCSLQELSTKEIPLSKINPRHDARKAANPQAYNSSVRVDTLVFN